jgi:hypothetical protein
MALAWRRRGVLARLAPPDRKRLLRELTDETADPEALDGTQQRLALAELNQRLADVSFELGVLPATYTALIRISLASGSALALVSFMTTPELAAIDRTLRLAIAALAGLVGAGVVGAIGRAAKQQSLQIKEKWDASSRDIGKALGTSLAGARSIGGNAR